MLFHAVYHNPMAGYFGNNITLNWVMACLHVRNVSWWIHWPTQKCHCAPFHFGIDFIGPLEQRASLWARFLDYAMQYLKTMELHISACSIVKAFFQVLSWFRISKEILTDQGTSSCHTPFAIIQMIRIKLIHTSVHWFEEVNYEVRG